MNTFWKGSPWPLMPEELLLFLTTRIQKMAVWKLQLCQSI